jgi:CRP/FNR family transcriptional regulator, cyclic AMP receptor protein
MLGDLPEDVAALLIGASRRRRYAANEVIVREGDPADSIHLIRRGHVAIMVTTPLGHQLTFTVMGPSESFGELSLLSGGHRTATARALEATETLALHEAALNRLRRDHPRVNDALLRVLSAQVLRLSERLAEHLYLPVEARIRRRLLGLCAVYDEIDGVTTIPLSQDELAELSGAARPTVNRVLRQDQVRGIVALARRRIAVLDREMLARQAQVSDRRYNAR